MGNGDFMAGEVRDVGAYVTVSNVVFGLKRFNTREKELLAVYLADTKPLSPIATVTLTDGSILHATSIRVRDDRLVVNGTALGTMDFGSNEIAELQCK